MIPTAATRTRIAPPARPLAPVLELSVDPATNQWWTLHGGASANAGRVSYSDLYGFLWYRGRAGYLTLNRGRKGICRTVRGAEDGKKRQG
jgi:hypothetical protein